MPTLASQLASGDGVLRARLVIAGWPSIYCDSQSLVGLLSDGRRQRDGLDPETLRIAATADLVRAEIEEQGATIELTDDSSNAITASLAAVPTARCWIANDATASAITINVTSTDGFPASGTIHIGTEAIRYASKSATAFLSCIRGAWDSTALAHYAGDGESTVAALVTDTPETIIGRRVSVYLYGSADPLTASGGGTERWRGIVRSAAEYTAGRWSFAVEPVSWILDQPIGGELVDGVPIRGIYLPASGAIDIQITRLSGASETDTVTADSANVLLSGFWADQAAFCTALTAALASETAGWSWDGDTELYAEPVGASGYRITYRVGATNAYFLRFGPGGGATDNRISPVDTMAGSWTAPGSTAPVAGVAASGIYQIEVSASDPRGVIGGAASLGARRFYDFARSGSYPSDRIYLGGRVVPATTMRVVVDPGVEDVDASPPLHVSSVDTSARWIGVPLTLRAPLPGTADGGYWLLGSQTVLRIMRLIASGHVGDLLDALVADSPTLAATGVLPLVVPGDISSDWTELEAAIGGSGWGSREWYAGLTSMTLRDMVTPELRAVGCYLAPTTTGALSIRRLRPPLRTDPTAGILDEDVVGGGLPALSLSPSGFLREVLYRTGWDQGEGEHMGVNLRVRSLAVPTSTSGVLEVAPRSVPVGDVGSYEYSIEEAYLLASAALGLFGRPYRVATLSEVSIAMIDAAQVGSIVVVQTDYLPALDGTMGLDQVGMVTGYDWSPYEGRGKITVLLQELETGGYSPAFRVANQSGAGATWTLTITLAPHTAESTVATWLQAGDEVRVIERDSVSPTRLSGTIDSIDSATTLTVTFDSTWTPGASEWVLCYDTTALVDETRGVRGWAQTDFAMIAGSDRRIALGSGDVDAREFSP